MRKNLKRISVLAVIVVGILCIGLFFWKRDAKAPDGTEKQVIVPFRYTKVSYVDQKPRGVLIQSAEELRKYYEDCFGDGKLHTWSGDSGFYAKLEVYDSTYFEEKQLVLVLLGEENSEIRHEVTNAFLNEQGKLEIQIKRMVPKANMSQTSEENNRQGWYVFVEISKDISVEEENIQVVLGNVVEEHPVLTIYFSDGKQFSVEGNQVWTWKYSMGLNRLDFQEAEDCKCVPQYILEIKSDARQERYELCPQDGVVHGTFGQAELDLDSVEYKAIQSGIRNLRYQAKTGGIEPDTSHLGFSVQYIRACGDYDSIPNAIFIRSVEELQQYFAEHMVDEEGEEKYYAERFKNAAQKFDEEYFKHQVLVLVETGDGITSVYYDVTSVSKNSDGELEIMIDRLSPEAGDTVYVSQLFLIELAEEMKVTGDEKIKILLDGEVVEYPVLTIKCPDGTTYSGEGLIASSFRNVISSHLLGGKENNCDCVSEYTITIESNIRHEVYEINLKHGCIHYNGKSVILDEDNKENLMYGIEDWINEMEVTS